MASKAQIEENRIEIERQLRKAGFDFTFIAVSDTNGLSIYYEVEGVKLRFSDHSVTNINRLQDEVHFDLPIKKTLGIGGVQKTKINENVIGAKLDFLAEQPKKINNKPIAEIKKLIQKAAGDRTVLIDLLLHELQKKLLDVQGKLLSRFVTEWVDDLDVDEETGIIKNTLRNKRLLENVDKVFAQYVKTDGVVIAKTMMDGINQILDFNGKYFKNFATHAELAPIKPVVLELMKSWLGLKGNGAFEGNGYLQKTISDPRILGELKNFALRAVVGQQGYKDTLNGVKTFIDGNRNAAGLLEKYHRNFVYDTYSQVDRATSGIFADKLGLDYAIYEGGLIKTSRKFCKDHNGKVYTREEIAAFRPKEAIPEPYNPFQDLGGYGCRHHLNWISSAVAVALRPDLAN